jgi:tRNA threonylcarbamoyladenosine biosynthesis protein TsaE
VPESLILTAATADELQAIGARLGRALAAGDVLALIGPLGAGKTTFVQGVARGLEVPPDRHVASPTFALVNEHPGRVPLVHADLYRINDPRELDELGLSDAFDRAVVAIEWLDRFPDAAPAERLTIEIAVTADGGRRLALRPTGQRASAVVKELDQVE